MTNTTITVTVVATRSTRPLAEKYIASFADCVEPGEWAATRLEGESRWSIVRRTTPRDYLPTSSERVVVTGNPVF